MKKLVVFQGESRDSCSPLYLTDYKLSESGDLLGGYVANGLWTLEVNEHGWFVDGSERHDAPEFFHLQFVDTNESNYEEVIHQAEVLMKGLDLNDYPKSALAIHFDAVRKSEVKLPEEFEAVFQNNLHDLFA